MSNPIRIVQITDTHIIPRGESWHDNKLTDTAGRLEKVIASINTLKPDLVIHTGDIVDRGDI